MICPIFSEYYKTVPAASNLTSRNGQDPLPRVEIKLSIFARVAQGKPCKETKIRVDNPEDHRDQAL